MTISNNINVNNLLFIGYNNIFNYNVLVINRR